MRLFTLAEERSPNCIGLKGTMNALFLKDLAQKVRRGLEGRVREEGPAADCVSVTTSSASTTRGEPIRGGRKINQPRPPSCTASSPNSRRQVAPADRITPDRDQVPGRGGNGMPHDRQQRGPRYRHS